MSCNGLTMATPNPYAPPRAAVEDIAAPGATSELAGRGTRLLAATVDGLIIAVFTWVPFLIAGGLNGALVPVNGRFNTAALFGAGSVVALLGGLVWCWLTIRYVQRNGQSIAKKMFGIKVVQSNGARASLGRIFWLRNVVNVVLGLIPFYGLIDSLMIFGEPRRCLHDRIADTIVIKA
jgi:uncharacterized RDD family membrane protein YckC